VNGIDPLVVMRASLAAAASAPSASPAEGRPAAAPGPGADAPGASQITSPAAAIKPIRSAACVRRMGVIEFLLEPPTFSAC
jgi:hypothetical protein